MKQIFLGTTNPGKIHEIKSALRDFSILITTPADLSFSEEVSETGKTYQDNATIKARHYLSKSGMPTIAEDSGIEVEALKEELGVQTRHWGAGANSTDEQWLAHFMEVMSRHPRPEQRRAKFVSHICLCTKDQEYHFTGETTGTITPTVEAPIFPGLPLSSVFRPDGFTTVYVALSELEKNQISHRGKAVFKLIDTLTTTPHLWN